MPLWVSCRMTHVYSLGHLMGRPDCGRLADHGVAALRGRFRDAEHGGWYAEVGADGPVSTDKTAYEHAFVVLAAASATAADRPGGRELLDEALGILLEHFWDDEHGMVREQWDEAWTTLDGYRGVNANMHTVEALLSAADVLDDTSLRDRAQRIVTRVVHDLARGNDWRIPEHFDDTWTPVLDYNIDEPAHPSGPTAPPSATGWSGPGWPCTCGPRSATTPRVAPRRRPRALRRLGARGLGRGRRRRLRLHRRLVGRPGRARADALGGGGGHRDRRGAARGDGRTGVRRVVPHVVAARRRPLPRPRAGSWHHELAPDLSPSSVTWPGKPDTYHAFQATLIPRLPLTPTLAAALRDGLLA